MLCVGFCCLGLFYFFLKAIKNGLGWREGTDGLRWAGGIFSFLLTKDWFLFKLVQKGGEGGGYLCFGRRLWAGSL